MDIPQSVVHRRIFCASRQWLATICTGPPSRVLLFAAQTRRYQSVQCTWPSNIGQPTMSHWLRSNLHLSVDEASLIVAFLALVIAALALVRPVQALTGRAIRRILLWSGASRRLYSRWYINKHSKLRKIYLKDEEELDLAQTYVPLSFISHDSAHEQRVRATNILADTDLTRILIIGDPGTGKSPLLTAFGAGILHRKSSNSPSSRSDLKTIAVSRELPFLITLRQFAPRAAEQGSLRRYMIEEILAKDAKVSGAAKFLDRLIKAGQCLVMLDGLDEVPDVHYNAVRDAIVEFASDISSKAPTSQARLVLSCRRQNFLRVQTDWIPTFATMSYILAPFRDADIFAFIKKRD